MTDQKPDLKSAWKEAGDRLNTLGSSLRTHYAEHRDTEAESGKQQMADAAKKLTGAVQDAFDAMSAAAKDPSVKDDVRRVGQSLAAALSATFAEVSDDLRRVADKAQAKAAGGTTAGSSAEPTAGTTPGATDGSAGPGATEGTAVPPSEPPKVEPWGTP